MQLVMKVLGPDKASIVKKKTGWKRNCGDFWNRICCPFHKSSYIGVTGSNGKTTTTMLTYHLLKSAGLNIGWVGKSFALQVATDIPIYLNWVVFSWRNRGLQTHIAIITNISPDHLDRYEYNYQNYINAKFRITMNQTEDDYLIYDADEKALQNG
jgi:UDP-N-acetylmuramoylalanine--D-glutamate ligase